LQSQHLPIFLCIGLLRRHIANTVFLLSLLFNGLVFANDDNQDLESGLTIQALRVDTGEAMWPVTWQLVSAEQRYDLIEDSSTLDLTRLQANELRAGDYTATAFSGNYAGSVSFSLPITKKVIYLDMHLDVPPTSVEISGPLIANQPFKVNWIGSAKPDDMIVIVPSGADYWQMFESAKVSEGNPLTLKAPDNQANYDLLYLSISYGSIKIAARTPFTIRK